MDAGQIGISTFFDALTHREAVEVVQRVEALGYDTLWFPEIVSREPFAFGGYMASVTQSLILGTGLANIYARDPMAMNAAGRTLAEQSGGRFLLGMGVSHAHLVKGVRGHEYRKPLTEMRLYLERMKTAMCNMPDDKARAPIILGALRPKMLALAAEAADGAQTYLSPPEHTQRAREVMGGDSWLCVGQFVMLEEDPERARTAIRKVLKTYLSLPAYRNNLHWIGYGEREFEDGFSDRLVDAVVAWGSAEKIRARVQEHFDAGADHVAMNPLRVDGIIGPDMNAVTGLAPRIEANS